MITSIIDQQIPIKFFTILLILCIVEQNIIAFNVVSWCKISIQSVSWKFYANTFSTNKNTVDLLQLLSI